MERGPIASEELLQDWRSRALRMEEEVAKAIIGQQGTLRLINVALFARGHVLLEGDVGIGKTTILRAFSRAVGGDFERVEGTVDLMPGDLDLSHLRRRRGQAAHRARAAAAARRAARHVLLQRDQSRAAAGAVAAAARDGRAHRLGVQPGIPLSAHDGVRRPQPGREGRNVRAASAARDRFMFELRMPTPAEPRSAARWCSTPRSMTSTSCSSAWRRRAAVAGAQRHRRRDPAQRHGKRSARALCAGPVGRQPIAAALRRAHRWRRHGQADSRRRQPARHDVADARGARASPGSRAARISCRTTFSSIVPVGAGASRVLYAGLRAAPRADRRRAGRADPENAFRHRR